ncbi:MAG: class I SAM-dependent methyltransferase [Chloroflexi bacterium]|nr:class I SAM-dependent methyltransferase [Chloroflexota bacterium]
MQRTNDTNAFYDSIAEHYPLFYRDWEAQLDREGLSLRAIFRNKGVERVLDAACGAGTQSVALAKLGFDVVACDPSAGMLRKASEIAEQYGVLEKIQFERIDFLHLQEIVSGPFDAIVCKGNSLPHLLEDEEIETTLMIFHELLRPGGVLVIGMRDFAPFMEDRPQFIPGFVHENDDGSEFITFDIWEWHDGPPVLATQNLFIVQGSERPGYTTVKRRVRYRPLSTDEVKVVLLEQGFSDITDEPDRSERVLVARKPLSASR